MDQRGDRSASGEKKGFGILVAETEPPSIGWADMAVVPLVALLSVPPLLWFGHHPWTIISKDTPRYLFAGSELVSGGASRASPASRTTTVDTVPSCRP